jgi:hypothetical protein
LLLNVRKKEKRSEERVTKAKAKKLKKGELLKAAHCVLFKFAKHFQG